jgi:hypothetical protein
MDVEVAAKLAAIGFGGITAWVTILGLLKARRSQLREDYRFAREFMGDLRTVASDSEFLKQRGCHALTGNSTLEYRTLKYLWDLENPSQAINDYSLGFEYLEHLRTITPHDSLQFKAPYHLAWRRRARKLGYLGRYMVMYTLACSPLLLSVFGVWHGTSPFIALLVTIPIFLPLAFMALKERVRIQRAERLVRSQKRVTPTVGGVGR